MLKIGLYGIYSKVKAMGAIVSKLESRSLEQNIAREAGDESLFFAKLTEITRNKHTKMFRPLKLRQR